MKKLREMNKTTGVPNKEGRSAGVLLSAMMLLLFICGPVFGANKGVFSAGTCLPWTDLNTDHFEYASPLNTSDPSAGGHQYGPIVDNGCDPSRTNCPRPYAHNMQGTGSPPRIQKLKERRLEPMEYELFEITAIVSTPRGAFGAGDDGNVGVDAFGESSDQNTYFVSLYYTTDNGASWNRVNMDNFATSKLSKSASNPLVYVTTDSDFSGLTWDVPDVNYNGAAYDVNDPTTWGVLTGYDPKVGDGPVAPGATGLNPGGSNAGVTQYRNRPVEYPVRPPNYTRNFVQNDIAGTINSAFFNVGAIQSPQPGAPYGGGDPNNLTLYPNVIGWPEVRVNNIPQVSCNIYDGHDAQHPKHPACGGPGQIPVGQIGYTLLPSAGQIVFKKAIPIGAEVDATFYVSNRSTWTAYLYGSSFTNTVDGAFSYNVMVTDTCGNIASGARSDPSTPGGETPSPNNNTGPWISAVDFNGDRRNIGEDPFLVSDAGVHTTCYYQNEAGWTNGWVECPGWYGCSPNPLNKCGGEGGGTNVNNLDLTAVHVTHANSIASGDMFFRIESATHMDYGCFGSWYPSLLGNICQSDSGFGILQQNDPTKIKAYALSITVDNGAGSSTGGTRVLLSIVAVDFLEGALGPLIQTAIDSLATSLLDFPGVNIKVSGPSINIWLDVTALLSGLGSGKDGVVPLDGGMCDEYCGIACPLDNCNRDCDDDGWYNCCGTDPENPTKWRKYVGQGGQYPFYDPDPAKRANCGDEAPEDENCQILPCPEACDVNACGANDWDWYEYAEPPVQMYRYSDCDGDWWTNCCPPGLGTGDFPLADVNPVGVPLCSLAGPCCGTGAPAEYEAGCITGAPDTDCYAWDKFKWCWVRGCPDECTVAPEDAEYSASEYWDQPCPEVPPKPPPENPLDGTFEAYGTSTAWAYRFDNNALLHIEPTGSVEVSGMTLLLSNLNIDDLLCALCLKTFDFSFFSHDATPVIKYYPGGGAGVTAGKSRLFHTVQKDLIPPMRTTDVVACRGFPTSKPDPYGELAANQALGGCVYSTTQYIYNLLEANVQSTTLDVRFTEPVFNADVIKTTLVDLKGYQIFRSPRRGGPFTMVSEMSLAANSGLFLCGSSSNPPNNDGSLQECSGYPNTLYNCASGNCPAIIPASDYISLGNWRYGVPGEFIHCFDENDGNCALDGRSRFLPDGQIYYYRMLSFDASPQSNISDMSNTTHVQIWRNDIPPTTPTLVSAIPISNGGRIVVNWQSTDDDADLCDIDLSGTPNDESDDITRDCIDRPGSFSIGGFYIYRCVGPADPQGFPTCTKLLRLISDKTAAAEELRWRPIPFYRNQYIDDNKLIDDDGDGRMDEDPPGDANNDGCPGVCNVDDDGDGLVDECNPDSTLPCSYDDDEDNWDPGGVSACNSDGIDNNNDGHIDDGNDCIDEDGELLSSAMKYRYVMRAVDLRFHGDDGTPDPNLPSVFPPRCGMKYDAISGVGGIDNDGDNDAACNSDGVDNNNDGWIDNGYDCYDEDPIDGVDNDGDGKVDEDPIDYARCDLTPNPVDYVCHDPADPGIDGANYEYCFFKDYLEYNYQIADADPQYTRLHTLNTEIGNLSGFSASKESYPVDNQAPGIPSGLQILNSPDASGSALLAKWSSFNIETDPSFNYFQLYRSTGMCGFDDDGDTAYNPTCNSDGIDNNHDGKIDDGYDCYDEDPYDNVDNDGDGLVDEDGCMSGNPRFGPYFCIKEYTTACTANFPANWDTCPCYKICNKDSYGNCALLTQTDGSDQILEYEDKNLTPNLEYFYRITAIDYSLNESALSFPPMSATPQDLTSPSQPSNFLVTVNSTGNSLNLSWDIARDSQQQPIFESDLAGYNIYRTNTDGSLLTEGVRFAKINSNTVPACTSDGTASGAACPCNTVGRGTAPCAFRTAITYSDGQLGETWLYWYRIHAVDNAANESEPTADNCDAQNRITCNTPKDAMATQAPEWTWTWEGTTYGTTQLVSPTSAGGALVLRFVPNDVRLKAAGTWDTLPNESDLAGYYVEMKPTDGAWQRLNPTELVTENNDIDAYSPVSNMEIGYVVSGLTNGQVYQFRIVAVDDAGAENIPGCSDFDSPGNEACSLVIQGSPSNAEPPAAPTGVSATPLDGAKIGIGWLPNTESDVAGYKVYYSDTGGAGTFTHAVNYGQGTLCSDTNIISALPDQIQSLTDSSADLVPGHRRYYVVTAFDEVCNESAQSSIVSAVVYEQDKTAPATPAGFEAFAGKMNDPVVVPAKSVRLFWTVNTEPDLHHYNIYMSETGQFGIYSKIKEVTCFTPTCGGIKTSADNANRIIVQNLVENFGYWFIVTAVDEGGNESLSPCMNYVTQNACNSDSFCNWDPSNNVCLGAVTGTNLNPYTAVYAMPTGTDDVTPPDHPIPGRVTAMPYGNALKFTWTPLDMAVSPNTDLAGYKIFRDTTQYPPAPDPDDPLNTYTTVAADIPVSSVTYENYQEVASISCTTDSQCAITNGGYYCETATHKCMTSATAYFIDDQVLNSTKDYYYYVITSYDVNGNECKQDPTNANYKPKRALSADTAPPLPPAGLSVSPITGNPNGLGVAWSDIPSLNEMINLGMADSDGDGYPNLVETNYGGDPDSARIRPVLPATLRADYSFVGFQLNRGRTTSGPWVTIDADPDTPGNDLFTTTSFYDGALQSGEQYCYRVSAVDSQGQKSTAYVDLITCGKPGIDNSPPAVPMGFTAVARNGKVDLTWSANSEPDLAGYKVYRCVGAPGVCGPAVSNPPFALLTTGTATSYSDTGVQNDTTYWYKVTAFDNATNIFGDVCKVRGQDNQVCPNESLYSDSVNATPSSSITAYGLSVPVGAGWNLLAFPPVGARNPSLAVSGYLPVFRFQSNGYQNIAGSADNALGVWYYSPQSTTITVEDMGARDSLTLGLSRGWNQIGNPFTQDMVWDNDHVKIKVIGGGVTGIGDAVNAGSVLKVFMYDPAAGYVPVHVGDKIPVGRGLWVKAAYNLTLEMQK